MSEYAKSTPGMREIISDARVPVKPSSSFAIGPMAVIDRIGSLSCLLDPLTSMRFGGSSFASAPPRPFMAVSGVDYWRHLLARRFKSSIKRLRDISNEHKVHLIAQFFGQVFHQVRLILLGQIALRNPGP